MKMADRKTINGITANDVREGHRGPVGMKRLASWCLLLIVTAYSIAGCGRNELLQVEKIMESDIETADSLIYTINEPTGKRNQAFYALLKTQIDYKMYRDAANDSIIRIATDYYGKKYKDYHAAMAWYSLGCVSAELGQDSTAADAYLTAIALFPDTMVRYYTLAEQNLSYIYLNHNMDAEAIQLIKACRANAERLHDSAAIAFCDFNIANSMLFNAQFDIAQDMFLELKDNKWLSTDTKEIPLIQLSKILQYKDGNYNESLNYIDSFIIRNKHQVPYGTAYSVKADAYYGLNQIDSAQLYYHLSLAETTDPNTICDVFRRLSEIQTLKGNKDSATYYIKKASIWMDSSMIAYSPNNIYKVILNNKGIITLPKSRLHKQLVLPSIILIVVLILICVTLQIIWYIERRKMKQEFLPIIDSFKKSELYKEMCDIVNKQEPITNVRRREIETKFHNSMNVIRNYIKASGKKVNNMDVDYCIFTMLGFMQKDFHLFFAISHSGSRNLKMRLSNKLSRRTYKIVFG